MRRHALTPLLCCRRSALIAELYCGRMAALMEVIDVRGKGRARPPPRSLADESGAKPRQSLSRTGGVASGGGAVGGDSKPPELRVDFSRFVFEALLTKYGLRSLARQKHQSLLHSLAYHVKQGQGGALLLCTRLCGVATAATPMGPQEEVTVVTVVTA